jgi:hypothetical protein
MIFSHTILRFSVEDACFPLPLTFLSFALASTEDFVLIFLELQLQFVDGKGVPLGITVDAAGRHDMKMTRATLQSMVRRPEPTTRAKQHMCMDKGYDYPEYD